MDRSELKLLQTHMDKFRLKFRKLPVCPSVRYDIYSIRLIKNAVPSPATVFVEATPLCLLVNKTHLLILTQHRFILIQF
jgi:hypothetical protein